MPNPYGMTEVDVPGLLAGYENTKNQRLARMQAEAQVRQADAQLEREAKVAQAWSKFMQPRGGVGGAAEAYPQSGAQQVSQGAQQPAQAPQQAEYDPWSDETAQNELFASLAAVDPKQAMEIRNAFSQHSEADRKQAAENWNAMASAFFQLRQLPPNERQAAYQQMLPMLRSLEIPEDMLAQPDLSDRGLEWGVAQARDIEKVIAGRTPDVVPVSGVGLFPVTPGSPYPDFSNGGARPEAEIGEGTVIQNDAGEQLILRNGQWVPMGGGVGNGTGGFPGP